MPKKADGERLTYFFAEESYYYASHNADGTENGLTKQEWVNRVYNRDKMLAETDEFEYIALVFHDKDYKDDKKTVPKDLHCHQLIKCDSNHRRTQSAMMTKFGITRVENCQAAKDPVDCARYLIHVSESALNAKKTIYPADSVYVLQSPGGTVTLADLMSRTEEKAERENKSKEKKEWVTYYSQALVRGDLTLLDVEQAIRNDTPGVGFDSRDWQSLRRGFEGDVKNWFENKLNYYQTLDEKTGKPHNRCLSVIYCEGPGGVGKGDLGLALGALWADGHGIHRVAAQGKGTTLRLFWKVWVHFDVKLRAGLA